MPASVFLLKDLKLHLKIFMAWSLDESKFAIFYSPFNSLFGNKKQKSCESVKNSFQSFPEFFCGMAHS
jgi:hypothetical protein